MRTECDNDDEKIKQKISHHLLTVVSLFCKHVKTKQQIQKITKVSYKFNFEFISSYLD